LDIWWIRSENPWELARRINENVNLVPRAPRALSAFQNEGAECREGPENEVAKPFASIRFLCSSFAVDFVFLLKKWKKMENGK